MSNPPHVIAVDATDDLLNQANPKSDLEAQTGLRDQPGRESDATTHTTGILPSHELERQVRVTKEIFALEPIEDNQFQPASIDLRLGAVAYRVRASFLPGKDATVEQRLEDLAMHKMDISNGGVLERGCVYIVPLLEGLSLRHRTSAMGNPKSSTGRLDIFTRLITDYGTEFDRVREQYKGPLYAEVSPRTFSVLVRKGSRLSQIRIRRGNPPSTDEDMRRLQQEHNVIGSAISEEEIRNGVPVAVDVQGSTSGGLIGYKARNHAGLIDIDKLRYYDSADFWEPVYAPRRGGLILDPAEFYILASRDPVRVPPTHAAEMIAYDTLVGEFRVHYAGFFDPGFGHPDAGGEGARAVLEVRSYEVPFVIEHGQVVGRLTYERLTAQPHRLYGAGVQSNYQSQGIALSKHFKPPTFMT
ncbi:MAG: 2-deoxycytidine 5-triphosphate deaminase [Betaproteobacteria bacterium]|jgi:dCTP deaminase|nr:2-deoxycytidine 5-triphosphate deaminase [Betaproteobacteria bacterium]MEA3155079.1 dCTP deaminase [Betaproteobacteria bacterium]